MPDRADAVALLESWVDHEGLRKHMYAVEAVMRHYARLHGEDQDLWGLAGLLHDLDWEKTPEEHPLCAAKELRRLGYAEDVVRAVLAHRSEFTGVEPESSMERHLVASDELSGLVYATCLVRPNGIDDLKPRSVTKKLKDKAFAAGVSWDEVERGVGLIGIERSEHIQNVIDGLRTVAVELEIRAADRTGQ